MIKGLPFIVKHSIQQSLASQLPIKFQRTASWKKTYPSAFWVQSHCLSHTWKADDNFLLLLVKLKEIINPISHTYSMVNFAGDLGPVVALISCLFWDANESPQGHTCKSPWYYGAANDFSKLSQLTFGLAAAWRKCCDGSSTAFSLELLVSEFSMVVGSLHPGSGIPPHIFLNLSPLYPKENHTFCKSARMAIKVRMAYDYNDNYADRAKHNSHYGLLACIACMLDVTTSSITQAL